MDQDTLVIDRIEAGKQVVQALDAEDYDLGGAFWNYFSDSGGWRLVLVPRDFEGGAVKEELLKIRRALNRRTVSFDLSDVKLMSSDNPLVRALSTLVRAEGVNGIRASGNWINSVYIEDAFIYRMDI